MLHLAHQLMPNGSEFGEPFDGLDPGNSLGFLFESLCPSQSVSARSARGETALREATRLAHRARSTAPSAPVRFRSSKQVGIGIERHAAIGRRGKHVVGIDDRQRARQKLLAQPPRLFEQPHVKGLVSHKFNRGVNWGEGRRRGPRVLAPTAVPTNRRPLCSTAQAAGSGDHTMERPISALPRHV